MGSLTGFKADDHQDSGFEPLTPGWYTAIISESEWRDTKSGNGRYLQLTFEIYDGPRKGKKLWERLNLENPNQTAVDIANESLASICRCVGVLSPDEPSELHFKPVQVKIKLREYNGDMKEEIKGYKAVEGVATPTSGSSTSTSGGSPPWQKPATHAADSHNPNNDEIPF